MIRMTTVRSALTHRLSDEAFDARLALWTCSLAGAAIVPLAIVALLRNGGGRAEFVLGIGLAVLAGLVFLLLGIVLRHGAERLAGTPARRRGVEFASYLGCLGLLVGGFRALPDLDLNPAGIVLVLLLVSTLSVAMLVLGMLTTLRLAARTPEPGGPSAAP